MGTFGMHRFVKLHNTPYTFDHCEFKKNLNMKNLKLLIGVVLTGISTNSFSWCKVQTDFDKKPTTHDEKYHRPHKCLSVNTTPKVSYNSVSTVLNVSFPSDSQGGKVEIYRNGTKVVNANAAAGATLVYTLRNYGNGCYTIVVSSGSTVVFTGNYNVK